MQYTQYGQSTTGCFSDISLKVLFLTKELYWMKITDSLLQNLCAARFWHCSFCNYSYRISDKVNKHGLLSAYALRCIRDPEDIYIAVEGMSLHDHDRLWLTTVEQY